MILCQLISRVIKVTLKMHLITHANSNNFKMSKCENNCEKLYANVKMNKSGLPRKTL